MLLSRDTARLDRVVPGPGVGRLAGQDDGQTSRHGGATSGCAHHVGVLRRVLAAGDGID